MPGARSLGVCARLGLLQSCAQRQRCQPERVATSLSLLHHLWSLSLCRPSEASKSPTGRGSRSRRAVLRANPRGSGRVLVVPLCFCFKTLGWAITQAPLPPQTWGQGGQVQRLPDPSSEAPHPDPTCNSRTVSSAGSLIQSKHRQSSTGHWISRACSQNS